MPQSVGLMGQKHTALQCHLQADQAHLAHMSNGNEYYLLSKCLLVKDEDGEEDHLDDQENCDGEGDEVEDDDEDKERRQP